MKGKSGKNGGRAEKEERHNGGCGLGEKKQQREEAGERKWSGGGDSDGAGRRRH